MKAKIVGETVLRLSKDLPPEDTAGEFIGIGFFRQPSLPAVLDGMDRVLELQNLGAYFEEAINWAIAERGLRVGFIPTEGRSWTEIDFPDDLEFARSIVSRIVER